MTGLTLETYPLNREERTVYEAQNLDFTLYALGLHQYYLVKNTTSRCIKVKDNNLIVSFLKYSSGSFFILDYSYFMPIIASQLKCEHE
jgi:hypothetical protein